MIARPSSWDRCSGSLIWPVAALRDRPARCNAAARPSARVAAAARAGTRARWRERHGERAGRAAAGRRSADGRDGPRTDARRRPRGRRRAACARSRWQPVERRLPRRPRLRRCSSRRASSPRSSTAVRRMPPSWFLALHVDGETSAGSWSARWSAIGAAAASTAGCGSARAARAGRRSRRPRRVARAQLVDHAASRSASARVGDLEHVLGVLLARAREVERAEEDGVVGDRHLRVHVVVDARRARRASSACRGRRRGSARAAAPSSASAGSPPTGRKTWRDLRRVADAGDVDALAPRSPRRACRGSARR